MMAHAPHAHDEAVFLKQGTLEVDILVKISPVGPGSAVYVNSDE
jgi:hypothetical protein